MYDKMKDCFDKLKENVCQALKMTDLVKMGEKLAAIKGPTLVTGVGGSYTVAVFLTKILSERNGIIAVSASPRDLLHMDLSAYRNVIAVSYSGNNAGVDAAFANDLDHYLFTGHPRQETDIVYAMPQERSYVSIAATVIPLALLGICHTGNEKPILDLLDKELTVSSTSDHFEVLYGYETRTAAVLLESSLTEGGLGSCVLHDKYNYCHGRINLSKSLSSDLIFFKGKTELDETLAQVLPRYYKNIIGIGSDFQDNILADLSASLQAMKLIRNIASTKQIEISDMKEVPDNDVLYLFKGQM